MLESVKDENSKDSHPDFLVVATGGEHTWVCRVPRDGVDAACDMTFQHLDQLASFFVPYVNAGICGNWSARVMTEKKQLVRGTFTAADDELLVCTAKAASDDKFALFLSKESPNDLAVSKIDQLNLIIGHIDQHVSRILANADTSHFDG